MLSENFKVIVVGGSITGLALARMLEMANIDFLVLEAYPDIAPQVGASIGLLPNGLRVLDQMGCYDKIADLVPEPVDKVFFQNNRGRTVAQIRGLRDGAIQRHGYPLLFLDRQMVLQVLHSSIVDKSKILTSKRVTKLELLDSAVKVYTKDGGEFTGNIVIGADGIHSAVREEMWRLADQLEPGHLPESEKTAMPCDYACIFGISSLVPGLDVSEGKSYRVIGEHYSFLVVSGPLDRCYWFLFTNLGQTYHEPNIPRLNKDDEKELAEKFWDHPITPTATFGDLYKARKISVLSPLPEYVYKRWFFRRIVTIGDSVHKFEPLGGQGGNSALETAASLVNHLMRALKEKGPRLEDAAVFKVFDGLQNERYERASSLVREAHAQQELEATETLYHKLVIRWVIPWIGTTTILDKFTRSVRGAVKLEKFPVPSRPRSHPFDDELVNDGKWSLSTGKCLAVFFSLPLAAGIFQLYVGWQ